MIPRYSRPDMTALWSEETKFRLWQEIEVLACEGMAQLGVIPKDVAERIRKNANHDPERIAVLEAELHHDVLAFLTSMAEYVGEDSRFVHQGMTSSDVLDTAFSVQLKRAGLILIRGLDELVKAIAERAIEHKMTICIGRSHGIHAEPTTFGLKLLTHLAALRRQRNRLVRAVKDAARCAISGAVGTYAAIDP